MKKNELRKLKNKLPKNYLELVKQDYNVTSQYILAILRGDRFNQNIINKLVEIAENHKKEQEELSKKAKSL